MPTRYDIARCLELQGCIFCKAFLNDGEDKLDVKNARKHLASRHEIRTDTMLMGIIYRAEVEKSLYSDQGNDNAGERGN